MLTVKQIRLVDWRKFRSDGDCKQVVAQLIFTLRDLPSQPNSTSEMAAFTKVNLDGTKA